MSIVPPEEINRPRRRLFGAAAVTVAAAQLGVIEPQVREERPRRAGRSRWEPALTSPR